VRATSGLRGAGAAGFALPMLMFLILVLLIAGMGFFGTASRETTSAIYRQGSSEAFYLADAAVERARARFLGDRSWRGPWTAQTGGRGSYDLSVRDTTWNGITDAVRLLATGHVGSVVRKVEVMAEIPPTAFGLGVLVMGDAEVGGNLCLDGPAHVNGDATGGSGHGSPHFTCGGECDEGWPLTPPPIYTDPSHFPGDTYYYVRGVKSGATYTARIYDEAGTDVTGTTDMSAITSYNSGTKTYTFSFDTAGKIDQYFDFTTGVFHRESGDNSVVVNFGEVPLGPTGALYSSIAVDGAVSSEIKSTLINTRFTGTTEVDRLATANWAGGTFAVRQLKMEPVNGIALVICNLDKPGSSQVSLGSPAWPALVYVTRDVNSINSNFSLTGTLIVLNDFVCTGGPNITYNSGFIENLPNYLEDDWASGVSGSMKVLRYREVAEATN
jgi:hypothetical protein